MKRYEMISSKDIMDARQISMAWNYCISSILLKKGEYNMKRYEKLSKEEIIKVYDSTLVCANCVLNSKCEEDKRTCDYHVPCNERVRKYLYEELDERHFCKDCKYFYTEHYNNLSFTDDFRYDTKNFCYAVREKEQVHPFQKACSSFKEKAGK